MTRWLILGAIIMVFIAVISGESAKYLICKHEGGVYVPGKCMGLVRPGSLSLLGVVNQ